MAEKVGNKRSLNNIASERGMVVIWRLKRGNGGECVGSEWVWLDGFGS